MSDAPLSRELALRIGLAARSLPGIDAGTLIGIVVDAVGLPLTADKLNNLGMKAFRQAGGETLLPVAADDLKAALSFLRGKDLPEDEATPAIAPYADGDMPGSLRVACASNRGEDLDGHFGSCTRFLVYQVSPEEVRLIDIRATDGGTDAEDKNTWRTELISDCQVLHVVSIGGPAAAKVVRANIHPVKHAAGAKARDVVADLQKVLAGTPPPWLARAMGREATTLDPFREAAEQ
ncbi:nitrogen fixation protein NifX [Rhodobium orientis]|uniref:Dinitrogenase iron-molybdenum cofactor biosynthesis protein n=1 Tax=Rhodobium orientis TaxID=34017 RepID=A0A327JKF4_9HYPH|nr:NifB/NifX family molybdenum-iron cluster-binding protein [Rhodobium orientis]MBB4304388.1 nitrogen fixation protein NifX [Rhodobium orientis]MBK5951994.1 dinitrogenase iron-molybdenum cofactor biosynthesis protein [Rhodobium orientis]RAI25773.1 dinitrogenase iron-molybdenum cofactor biosynthesis protein [Rhodobium orientis]